MEFLTFDYEKIMYPERKKLYFLKISPEPLLSVAKVKEGRMVKVQYFEAEKIQGTGLLTCRLNLIYKR